jgi:hypothetical protein
MTPRRNLSVTALRSPGFTECETTTTNPNTTLSVEEL